ncbi:omega-hydroxypalmitate O-feruloyl transferase-like [Papaver somniferum]|uniref:omega-hydroxypalmitate O-feruloyl transferase-like n=1 Tax=Papaver somniferum TaxID=3469 RepID=UPI000E6FD388|nr:omega-hydroxypalmitate O-feruloyl transferase-like [Papaver somniferum]
MEKARNKTTFGSGLIVKIKGETMVPPAEETPKDLHFLSNLDTRVHMIDTIYFFNETTDVGRLDAAEIIKDGLGKVLVHYYPVAGRIIKNEKGKFMVHCTGEGALFVDAEANLTLDEMGDFTKPDPATYGKLVYGHLDQRNILLNPLVVAQVTKFKCGGFVLGLSMNHAMADGTSTVEFMRSWDIVDVFNTKAIFEQEMLITKSFIFHRENLEKRKKKAMEDGVLRRCSSFEVLTALMWRARTQSLRYNPDQQVRLLFVVDVRSRLDPKLPKGYFGNAFLLMNCQCSVSEMLDSPLSSIIERIQRSMKMVTDEYVKSTIDFLEEPKGTLPHSSTVFLSAWSNLGYIIVWILDGENRFSQALPRYL